MDDWSTDAKSVLDAARGTDDPSRADRARIDARMASKLGAAALVTSGVVASTTGASASAAALSGVTAGVGLGVKVAAAVVAVAMATGGGVVAWRGAIAHRATTVQHAMPRTNALPAQPGHGARTAAEAPAARPTPVAIEPSAPVAIEQTAPVIAMGTAPSTASSSVRVHRVVSVPVAPDTLPVAPDTLRDENDMVQSARAALQRGDATDALSWLDRYAARYPHARHAEAASVTRVFALCAAHRTVEARAAATAFERAWPDSPFRSRVASACEPH